jgi:hypothetical protein
MVASLLAYGLAADPYNTTIGINTTGVSSDGIIFEVTAPSDNASFVFDFTQPGTNLYTANWTAFQDIVAKGSARYLHGVNTGTGQWTSSTITVNCNTRFSLVLGTPTVTGTGFDLSRYQITVSMNYPNGMPGGATWSASQTLDKFPFTVQGGAGTTKLSFQLSVYVKPTDVPSGYNQTITIPFTIVPTP